MDNDSSGNVGRESGKKLSADTRESANNEEGVSGEVRDSRRITNDKNVTDLVAEVKESYPNATADNAVIYWNEKTTVVAVVSDKHLDLRVQTEYVGVKKETLLR